jgi:putative ABC transport system permease protein
MTVLQDIRLALRLLRRAPTSTAIALTSIAVSVGATAVVFAAIKSVLIDPLPFVRPAELVQLRSEFPTMRQQSHGDWVVWNDTREVGRRTRTLGPVGVYANAIFDLAGDANATPEALYGVRMNSELFPVLGVSPMVGRNVLGEEDRPGRGDVMILSYGLWLRRFHSDPSIVGRTVTVNGHACLVLGVMPPDFNFPLRREAAHTPSPYVEFWATPLHQPANPDAGLGAVARLRPGVSLQQARQDIADMSAALAHDFPATNRDRVLVVNGVRDRGIRGAGKGLVLLMGAALLFMLIGCANVANLVLARAIARQREMAVRVAIGAGRGRIARQLLTESSVLAVLGGLVGYALTIISWRILPAIAPVSIPRLASARADSAVLVFALAMAVINGILFGLAPAIRMARDTGLSGRISQRRVTANSGLVITEVAVCVLLVVIGGQVLASFVRLITTDPGFDASRVLASVVLAAPERYPTPTERGTFYKRILDAVRAIPGVESAGTVDALPFSGENHGGQVDDRIAEIDVVGGDYLQAMGIRLLDGRWFREEEMNESNDSAIVSAGLARVGQRICVFCTPEHPNNWKRVIGVVSPSTHSALDEGRDNVYLAAGAMQAAAFLVVRTGRPAAEIGQAIRRAIAAIDPNQPVFLSATMRDLIADSVADRRFVVVLLAITGCLALIMSAGGVYGVISYATSHRAKEIGIRMAVGAAPGDVLGLIFRQGFATVGIGLAVGLTAAFACVRFLRAVLAGIDQPDPAGIWIPAALVTAAAALTCWFPARRAVRTDPVAALRHE